MKIKRLEIANYRSCISTRIDIKTNLTTLIGINGVGKTNILNSIQLLKRVNRNKYFHQKSVIEGLFHTQLDILLQIGKNQHDLQVHIYYETNESNVEDVYSAELKIRQTSKSGKGKWNTIDPELFEFVEYMTRTGRTVDFTEISRRKNTTREEQQFGVNIITYLMNISYYSATQFSDPTKCPISLELDDPKVTRTIRKLKNHEQFIFDMYRTYKSDQKSFSKFLDIVNQNGIGLIDNITFFDHNIPSNSIKVRAGGQVQTIERVKNIVVPTIVIDGLNLSPNQLSEGTFKTLALIFYILNDESDLLLIEEPEVCVHHGLLGSIIELIQTQSKTKQIFISTHSDYVLDKLKPENVVLVSKTREAGTIASGLPSALSRNDYKALKEYLKESGNLGEYWKTGGFNQ